MADDPINQFDELKLVTEILNALAKSSDAVRSSQILPLAERLREATSILEHALRERLICSQSSCEEKERNKRLDCLPDLNSQDRQSPGQHHFEGRKSVVTKPSSVTAFRIPRDEVPNGPLAISKEVSRYIAASLYNILESATRLVKASSSHIFVRKEDEMISIANCATKLSFPPQLIHHRCLGSSDAEVLASGIALNQYTMDSAKITSSVIIFPVFSKSSSSEAVAVVHMESKFQGREAFTKVDEGVLLTTSQLIGELMSNFPQMDWIKNFYDPVTQHILAPFKPKKKTIASPGQGTNGKLHSIEGTSTTPPAILDKDYLRKVEECDFQMLIRREVLPRLRSQKTVVQGLSPAPTLREIDAYVENMQSCWSRSLANYISYSEEEHSNSLELKVVRRELTRIKALYEQAEEELRLYRLEGRDYRKEFSCIKDELDSYIRKRDKTSS
ncbi:hypothetical protein TRVL_08268 [Trypanosoma vivax]|uniref:GAF domain-containing protein n=1 Tax=Trypanosoma vivax (strain Y486) TaxID=1055687 RepID=G0U6E3_TRYVY|nr:hypothetical protein TRVL_08268 [Trypanosoma vivax]CCC51447.1 conserved hypothetical protein [Trypanosoma vivax Y486]